MTDMKVAGRVIPSIKQCGNEPLGSVKCGEFLD